MSLQMNTLSKDDASGRSRLTFGFMKETSFTYQSSSDSEDAAAAGSEFEDEEAAGGEVSEDENWQGLGLDEKEVTRLSAMHAKNTGLLRKKLAARLARASMPAPLPPKEMIKVSVSHNGSAYPELLLRPDAKTSKVPFGKLTLGNHPGHSSNNSLSLELQLPGNQFYSFSIEGVKLVSDEPEPETPTADSSSERDAKQLTDAELLQELENWDGEENLGSDVVPALYTQAYDVLKNRHMQRCTTLKRTEFDFEPDAGEDLSAKFLWVNCDRCKQWRRLDNTYKYELLPPAWFCEMHPSFLYSSCHSPPEIVRSEMQDETCSICLKGSLNFSKGKLLYCAGPCLRAFHSHCVAACTESESGLGDWFCSECITHSHSCTLCKLKGRSGDPVTKCLALNCGCYYHRDCANNTMVTNKEGESKGICARHFCAECGESAGLGNPPLLHCMVCPVSYHRKCIPKRFELLTDNTFICKGHKDRENTNKKLKKLVMTQVYNRVEVTKSEEADEEADEVGEDSGGADSKENSDDEAATGKKWKKEKSMRRSARSRNAKKIESGELEIQHDNSEAADVKNSNTRLEAINKISYTGDGQVVLPVILDHGRALLHLGSIDGRSTFCTKRFIYPVGFKSICEDLSLIETNRRCAYVNEVVDGGDMPLFKVTCTDASDSPFTSTSPTAVWALIYQKLYQLSPKTLEQQLSFSFVNGADKFGLSSPVCRYLIEQLPNRQLCTAYDPVALLENPNTSQISISDLKNATNGNGGGMDVVLVTSSDDEEAAADGGDQSDTVVINDRGKRGRSSSGARKRQKGK
jgi:hypothetical protein